MLKRNVVLLVVIMSVLFFNSCGQEKVLEIENDITESVHESVEIKNADPHYYSGWFCPDNLGGFPPADIQSLNLIPVVNDRLPTKEETENGTSLMYFDPAEVENAIPLDMTLPKVARIHSGHNNIKELIIVIQAVVIDTDTVVGYRFVNGGNGSAWLSEVDFLSDQELKNVGPTPYVFLETEIKASKKEVWEAISSTQYAKELGVKFHVKEFFETEWKDDSVAYLNMSTNSVNATGTISDVYGNLYMHVDYMYDNFHFNEKILVIEDSETKTSRIQFVSGPYPNEIDLSTEKWERWFQSVKELSEEK